TTGTTLAANALKVIEDGVILRSQANLVAARAAAWSDAARAAARAILDRIAAQAQARAFREVRARITSADGALAAAAHERFGATAPLGMLSEAGVLTLHCPPDAIQGLADFLRDAGAEAVTVAGLDYVFTRQNALYARLEAGLAG
ncbi:MAG TPA: ATP phosphoribosyltransferase, partial [Xanthobacteraceae bacterium]|nr:ATP phosphoribosyltransferase [Xanthobacteraceae bacterium]